MVSPASLRAPMHSGHSTGLKNTGKHIYRATKADGVLSNLIFQRQLKNSDDRGFLLDQTAVLLPTTLTPSPDLWASVSVSTLSSSSQVPAKSAQPEPPPPPIPPYPITSESDGVPHPPPTSRRCLIARPAFSKNPFPRCFLGDFLSKALTLLLGGAKFPLFLVVFRAEPSISPLRQTLLQWSPYPGIKAAFLSVARVMNSCFSNLNPKENKFLVGYQRSARKAELSVSYHHEALAHASSFAFFRSQKVPWLQPAPRCLLVCLHSCSDPQNPGLRGSEASRIRGWGPGMGTV